MKRASQSLLNSDALSYLYCANFKDMSNISDLTGKVFGRLTVISFSHIAGTARKKRSCWKCKCSCGNHKTIYRYNLTNGHTKSCGCLRVESATKHSYSGHQLYSIWEGMVARCYNKKASGYRWYGLMGIKMDNDWRSNPGVFINWAIEKGWQPGLSIERLDNNKNYEPSNCKLIPLNMQPKNTRKSHRILYEGVVYTQRDLAKKFGIPHSTLAYRLKNGIKVQALDKKE